MNFYCIIIFFNIIINDLIQFIYPIIFRCCQWNEVFSTERQNEGFYNFYISVLNYYKNNDIIIIENIWDELVSGCTSLYNQMHLWRKLHFTYFW